MVDVVRLRRVESIVYYPVLLWSTETVSTGVRNGILVVRNYMVVKVVC